MVTSSKPVFSADNLGWKIADNYAILNVKDQVVGKRPFLLRCFGGGGSVELEEARRQELVDGLASTLERWGLATPAAFFLEWNRPLSFVGSQFLLLAQPFLSPFVSDQVTEDYVALLEDRSGLDLLVERLVQGRHGEDQTQ